LALIRKVISCFQPELLVFPSQLIHIAFSVEVFNLLLALFASANLAVVILKEVSESSATFAMFLECSGFDHILDYLTEHGERVLQLLNRLAVFGPRLEIETFGLGHPLSSTPFQCDQPLLAKLAEKITVLLPFSKT
jgi:hypothetical protein